jgi:hypothetical protein
MHLSLHRFPLIFLVLAPMVLCVPSSRAQVWGNEAVADSVDFRGYFPLETENRWEFRTIENEWTWADESLSYTRWSVAADTVVSDTTYFRLDVFDITHSVRFVRSHLVRFDDDTASLVERARFADGSWREICFMGWGCSLADDFYSESPNGFYVLPEEDRDAIAIGADTLAPVTMKHFQRLKGVETVVHGIGLAAGSFGDTSFGRDIELVYVRAGARTYGVPVPVSIDAPADVRDRPVSLSIFPNPTTGWINIRTESGGGEARLEVFDVTGRRVFDLVNGAGSAPVTLDLSGLPAGVYVVRFAIRGAPPLTRMVIVSP